MDDPRLDTSAWRVFGRRFPRRWSLYFRIVALLVLLLALAWWFTRDVTYIGNVKVSGLEATDEELREPLRELSESFAALVNELSERGYAWQSGALPAMRTADALSDEESKRFFALGTLEVKGGASLTDGEVAADLAEEMRERGWRLSEPTRLEGAAVLAGPLTGTVTVRGLPDERQRLSMEITAQEE